MSRVTFRLSRHALRGVGIVEILLDGNVCAAIYPDSIDPKFHVVTPHATMTYDDGTKQVPQMPAWTFTLNPRRYHIGPNGEIIYVD